MDFGHGLGHGLGQSHDFGHGHDFGHACPLISVVGVDVGAEELSNFLPDSE